MAWSREDFKDQMQSCRNCGALCDGDVCDETCGRELDERRQSQMQLVRADLEPLAIRLAAGMTHLTLDYREASKLIEDLEEMVGNLWNTLSESEDK